MSPSDTPDISEDAQRAALPHDRDEKPVATREDGQTHANRAPVRQAHADVESGVQDTERIGIRNDVPSSSDNADAKR